MVPFKSCKLTERYRKDPVWVSKRYYSTRRRLVAHEGDVQMTTEATAGNAVEWKPTACILCECNCGILVQLGGDDGRHFAQIRGDKAHPASKGYTCQKALRLDHYQNGRGERILHPLRKRADGSFEEIDWDTAIREVAARLGAVRDTFGGETILYYGGGGQGNHLGGSYSTATLRAFGAKYRSSAIAQEKTGEVWVNGLMFGTPVRGDFEHCEVALFVGKNPWQSHSFPHARLTLRNIARDPARSIIVIDPRRTETAEFAEFHLQVRPGRDAWLLAAMAAVLVEEKLLNAAWLAEHASGVADVIAALSAVPIPEYCRISGVDEALVRGAARRIARASSVAVFEDLGVQMNRHSTLVSYLEKLVWALTGNLGQPGAQYAPATLIPIVRASKNELDARTAPVSPVVGATILRGLIPCNAIPPEILTAHPKRYRALFVESGNPAHSLADSQRMREAIARLDVVVAIDVFMTETARLADYVLPAATQFEKYEATFFNFEFPRNVFHLRRPLLTPPEGPLSEPEIHARLVEAAGVFKDAELEPLRAAARRGGRQFGAAFAEATKANPRLGAVAPVVLYRTLGQTLPNGAAAAAALWPVAHRCASMSPDSVRRAGFGEGLEAGEKIFDAIVSRPSGAMFSVDDYDAKFRRSQTHERRVRMKLSETLCEA